GAARTAGALWHQRRRRGNPAAEGALPQQTLRLRLRGPSADERGAEEGPGGGARGARQRAPPHPYRPGLAPGRRQPGTRFPRRPDGHREGDPAGALRNPQGGLLLRPPCRGWDQTRVDARYAPTLRRGIGSGRRPGGVDAGPEFLDERRRHRRRRLALGEQDPGDAAAKVGAPRRSAAAVPTDATREGLARRAGAGHRQPEAPPPARAEEPPAGAP